MPSPAEFRAELLQERQLLVLGVAAAGLVVVGLGAWWLTRGVGDTPSAGAGGAARRKPVEPGFVGCPGGLSFGSPVRGDLVAVELEDADEEPVEYAWMLVQSVNPERTAVSGVLVSSASDAGGSLRREEHGFSAGDELQVLMECLADRIRTTSDRGEPLCGPAGAVVQDVDEPTGFPVTEGRASVVGRRLRASVAPRLPGGRVPALESIEPVVAEIYALSPMGVARGTVVSRTTKADQHGYDMGSEIDLTPDCVYGVEPT